MKVIRNVIFTLMVLAVCHQTTTGQVLISLILGDNLNSGKVEFGLDGGVNYSMIRGLDESDYNNNFNIGFYFDIKLKNPAWMIHTGVIVKSTVGTAGLPVYSLDNDDLDRAFAGGTVERRINYFHVPVMIKQLIKKRISWELGICPALRSKAYDIFTAEVDGDLQYKREISDEYHRIDFGLMGGIGYRLFGGNGMNLSVRYYYGLTDITVDDSQADQFNESLYLAFGIPVGVAKAKKRAEKKAEE